MKILNPRHKRYGLWSLIAGQALVIGPFLVPAVEAGPLDFSNVVALQDNGFTSVPLFPNPGVVLQAVPFSIFGPSITFETLITGTLPLGATDTLEFIYTQAGASPQVVDLPVPESSGTIFPPYIDGVTFHDIGTYPGVAATLKIDLLLSNPDFVILSGPNARQRVNSYMFSFIAQLPVPEPNTGVLVASAALLWGLKLKLRRRGFNSK